jgi:two-component system response regulator NreC
MNTLSVAVIATNERRQRCLAILAKAGVLRVVSPGVGLVSAPRLLRRHRPNVLLLDAVEFPRRALGMLPTLRRLSPTTGVILLGKNGTRLDVVLEGLRRGAWGHLRERDLSRDLPKAVRTVATRQPWFPRQLGAVIVAELRAASRAPKRRPRPRLRLIRGRA